MEIPKGIKYFEASCFLKDAVQIQRTHILLLCFPSNNTFQFEML